MIVIEQLEFKLMYYDSTVKLGSEWGDFIPFEKGISPKVNLIAQQEFEFTYCNVQCSILAITLQ